MANWSFVEPSHHGGGPIEVYVTNSDDVYVILDNAAPGYRDGVMLSYWQLVSITKKIRGEFAFQLDREERELLTHGSARP